MKKFLISSFLILLWWAGVAFPKVLTLDEAINKALSTHPRLSFLRKELSATYYAKKAQAASRWLKAEVIAQAERHSDPVAVVPISVPGKFPAFSRDIYLWELDLSLPLYEGGRIKKAVKLKELEFLVKQSMLRQSAEDLIANVKQLYYQILYLEALSKTQERLLEILKKQREAAFLKYRLGKIPRLDLLHFDRLLREEEAALTTTKENLILAKRILALLIGAEDKNFEVSGRLEIKNVPRFDKSLLEAFISERADIKASYLKVEQANTAFEATRRTYFPKVFLFSSYGRRAGSGLNYDEEVWAAGIRLELTLFDSGITKNRLREKKALVEAAREALSVTRLKAKEEILSSAVKIKSSLLKIEKYKASQTFAQEAFEREKLRYEQGACAVTDLLYAQEAWLKAKAELLKAYYELRSALVSFELATGQIAKGYLK